MKALKNKVEKKAVRELKRLKTDRQVKAGDHCCRCCRCCRCW